MRPIDEIKANLAAAELNLAGLVNVGADYHKRARNDVEQLRNELRLALTADIPLDRLEQICAAEKDGRCVVLPCKLETPIVRILAHCTHAADCDEDCNDRDTGEPCDRKQRTGECKIEFWKRGFMYCDIGDFGKTVFLTREKAEAALAAQS